MLQKFFKIDKTKFKKNFSNLKNKDEIFNNFINRVQIDKKKALIFFEKSLSNIELNEKIIEEIVNKTQYNNTWKRDISSDFDRYLLKLSNFSKINQTTIYKIYEDEQNYSSLSSDNKNLIFTKEEIIKIISKNELKNNRYVFVPNQEYDDKLNFEYKKISNFLNGYIEYSKNSFSKYRLRFKDYNFRTK